MLATSSIFAMILALKRLSRSLMNLWPALSFLRSGSEFDGSLLASLRLLFLI